MIILPQCIKRMLPPWMNLYAILTMATVLTSIVGVNEVMTLTRQALSRREPRRAAAADLQLCAALVLPLLLSDRALDRRLEARTRSTSEARCHDRRDADRRSSPSSDVHKSFGSVEVLKGVSLDVPKGEVVCIIGPSGSGKSTLLRCINALVPIDSGIDPRRRFRGAGAQRPTATSSRCARKCRWCSSNTTCFRTRPRWRTS